MPSISLWLITYLYLKPMHFLVSTMLKATINCFLIAFNLMKLSLLLVFPYITHFFVGAMLNHHIHV